MNVEVKEITEQLQKIEQHEKEIKTANQKLEAEAARLNKLLTAEVTRGTLRMTIERADIYIDTETFGKMDPFVVIQQKQTDGLATSEHSTTVKDSAGKKPVWNETFDVPVSNFDLTMNVHMWEKDTLSNDDLGQFKITPKLFARPNPPEKFQCFIDKKNTATLYMKAKWIAGPK